MEILDIPSLTDYSEYIDKNPDEYKALFDAILVNKTRFFRDPEAWDFITKSVLPDILDKSKSIKIWSVGCASGEEPYSIGIAIAEVLKDQFDEYNVRIYATDIDESSLKFARAGTYTPDQMDGVSEYLRDKYFTNAGRAYTISKKIRRLLIFSRNNLVSDPTISKVDLLICRNVLIYFNQALKPRIIHKLGYALINAGYLWLGKAEVPKIDFRILRPFNVKYRIFKKAFFSISDPNNNGMDYSKFKKLGPLHPNKQISKDVTDPVNVFIILDKELNVLACNQLIRDFCGISPEKIIHKPFLNTKISRYPIDLEPLIHQALAKGRSILSEEVEHWILKDKCIYLRINVIPFESCVIIFMEDNTENYEFIKKLKIANRSLEEINKKLNSENEELQNSNKELQLINKELQSANKELESINAELMSRLEESDISNYE
jgi:two-component system CheB/CheR fusion protein